jgi:capsular polysaccharide biosynthesis protein
MNLKVYLAILWGNKWVILTTVLVTVAVVTTLTIMTTPTYTATATLRVATAASGTVSYSDYMYADRLMNTYVKLATSGPVLGALAEKLGITQIPEIKVVPVPNTELIQISVVSADPRLAQSAANTLGEILVAQSKELYSGGGKSPLEILGDQLAQAEAELKQARLDYEALVASSPKATEEVAVANKTIELREKTYASLLEEYEQARLREALQENTISVVVPAVIPLAPSQPRVAINIALGFVVGLCGGVGLAFLVENLNSRLYTSEQIEELTGLTLLSKIPATKRKLLSPSNNGNHPPDMPLYEAFRRLRTNILI